MDLSSLSTSPVPPPWASALPPKPTDAELREKNIELFSSELQTCKTAGIYDIQLYGDDAHMNDMIPRMRIEVLGERKGEEQV